MRPKNLVRDSEIRRVVELAKELGLTVGAIDVRTDSVTVHTTPPPAESSYAQWKRENGKGQTKAEATRVTKR